MAFDFEWDDNEERKIRNRPCGGEKVLLLWKSFVAVKVQNEKSIFRVQTQAHLWEPFCPWLTYERAIFMISVPPGTYFDHVMKTSRHFFVYVREHHLISRRYHIQCEFNVYDLQTMTKINTLLISFKRCNWIIYNQELKKFKASISNVEFYTICNQFLFIGKYTMH